MKPLTVEITRMEVCGIVTHAISYTGKHPSRVMFCFDELSDALLRVAKLLSSAEPRCDVDHPRKFKLKSAILDLLSDGEHWTKEEIMLKTKAPTFARPAQTYGTVLATMVKHGTIVNRGGMFRIRKPLTREEKS